MKTTGQHIQNWLRRTALVLMALVGMLTVAAQEAEFEGGEAFYIYQNDGHFDGFFYDEVKQISYSRFDTLGIEHPDYVSQEIVTEDSIYRIMLTAIDSVSFVQPEIKYAKGVRFMRDEGLLDYFLNAVKDPDTDEIIVTFRNTMPEELKPKVGDVLQCPNLEGWEEGTLVAKVDRISEAGTILLLKCSYVDDLKDVFEQFITVEQVRQQPGPSGSRTIRRMAGINAPKHAEGNVSDLTLFSFNHTFEAKLKLGKCDFQFTLSGGFGMNMTVAYKITLSEFYIKTQLKSQMSIGTSIGLDGQIYESLDPSAIPGVGDFIAQFAKVPFPANFPILYANVLPVPFTRAEAHLNLSASLGAQVKATNFMLEIKDRWPYVDMGLNFIAPFLPYEASGESGLSITAQLNGSVQTGMKFPITVSTLPWVKKCCFLETGNTVFAGPKLSGNLDLELQKAISGEGIYETMKSSKVDFSLISIDNELEGKATIFGKEWATKHTKSWAYGTMSFTLFPEFDNMEFEVTGDNLDHIKCAVDVAGLTCLPERIGIGIYKQKDESDTKFTELYDKFYRNDDFWFQDNFNKVEGGFTEMEPGEYRLRPIISFPGVESLKSLIVPVYSAEKAVIIEQKGLTLTPDSAIFEEDGGELKVIIKTPSTMPVNVRPIEDWIHVDVTQPDPTKGDREMVIKVDPNDEDRFRKGSITVEQIFGPTEMDWKDFVIKQYGGLQLSVSSLDIEADGSSSIVQILTSMKPITINLKAATDWISYELDDRELNLHFTKNNGAQRTATIVVAAWNEKSQGIRTVELTVTQKGLVDASLEPTELSFEATGGTQRVNVKLGENTTFNDVIVGSSDKSWIGIEKGDSYFNLTALPNTETTERETTVDVSVTTKKPDGTTNTVMLPVKVTQKFSAASVEPSELHFKAEGGSQKVKVDISTYPYYGIASISDGGDSWIDTSTATDGTVTITATANAGTQERECSVVCFVSGVKDPSSEQMIKLPVKVIQAGKTLDPVTPDGDKSPFKHITFSAGRTIKYPLTDDDGTVRDTTLQILPFFRFTPDNAHFTVSYNKEVNHYECQGYEERATNETKSRGILTFDIEKKTKKVKNLRFTLDSESLMTMTMWGVRANTTVNAAYAMTTAETELETNSSEYKHGKWTIADGLSFSSFSGVAGTKTTYTIVNEEVYRAIYGDDDKGFDPVSTNAVYESINDPSDYVELYIAYKDGQGEPVDIEWPSEEVMNSLTAGGQPIYEGSTPPTVNGTYVLSAPTVVTDKGGYAEDLEGLDNFVIKLSDQQNGEVKLNTYYVIDGEKTSDDGELQGIIQGSGDSFSICAPDGYGSAVILSGKLQGNQIEDLHYTVTNMDKANDFIIIKDGDGVSTKTTWSPGTDDWTRALSRRPKK